MPPPPLTGSWVKYIGIRGSLCCIGGARAQQISRRPSGDIDIWRLLRLQSQAGMELRELGHTQLGTKFRRYLYAKIPCRMSKSQIFFYSFCL